MSTPKQYFSTVHSNDVSSDDSPVDEQEKLRRARERFRAMVEQMMAEFKANHGTEWGGITHIAERIGINQGYLSEILRGGQGAGGVGIEKITTAIHKVGLRPDFFWGDHSGVPLYRDFLVRSSEGAPEDPHLSAFLRFAEANYAEEDQITPQEAAILRSYRPPAGFKTNKRTFHFILEAIRFGLDPVEATKSGELTETMHRRAKRRGHKPSEPLKKRRRKKP